MAEGLCDVRTYVYVFVLFWFIFEWMIMPMYDQTGKTHLVMWMWNPTSKIKSRSSMRQCMAEGLKSSPAIPYHVDVSGCEPHFKMTQSSSISSSPSSQGNAGRIRVQCTCHDLEICNTIFKHTIHQYSEIGSKKNSAG